MTSYQKSVLLDVLKELHDEESSKQDRQHTEDLAKHARADLAKNAAVEQCASILRSIQKAATWENVREFVNPIVGRPNRGSYRESVFEDALARATVVLEPRPERTQSIRERTLENVIRLVETASGETISVADLRAFNVLQFVQLP